MKTVQSVNTGCYVSHVCTSIFLYADDILLLAPSVSSLQKLLSACEEELYFVDIRINDIWVFILSVLGRSNVLLSPPDPNFINLLTQYLAKLDELHQRVS